MSRFPSTTVSPAPAVPALDPDQDASSRISTAEEQPRPTRSRGRKDALDKFYTKPAVAELCLSRLDLDQFDRIIEPSAGGGAFSDLLFARDDLSVLAFDLLPESPRVVERNWFDFEEVLEHGRTLVVGNPPFGRNSSLAHKFIRHAFEVVGADTVAFVLPRSFVKDSVQDRVYRCAKKVDEVFLPDGSFLLHGEDYSLPTVFQVWERTAEPRPLSGGSLGSPLFSWVRKPQPHEVVVRRVGGNAGRAFEPSPDFSEQTNYFIRLSAAAREVLPARSAIELINAIDFVEARNGTGPNTLSKREFVRHFEAAARRELGVANWAEMSAA